MWNISELEESLLIGSTLVEGSTLSEAEAQQAIQGKTITGHPLNEIRELVNYKQATLWLIDNLRQSPYLSIDLILGFHKQLMQGLSDHAGKWKSRVNYTYQSDGNRHDYLHPSQVQQAMQLWIKNVNANAYECAEEGAAKLYLEFQNIHPFEDGNGRLGRIIVSYWLHWKWNCRFEFYLKDKLDHLNALEDANNGNINKLIKFFAQRTKQ